MRFQTPLEEVEGETLLEKMLEYLNGDTNMHNKQLFNDYEKDRGLLMKVLDGALWFPPFYVGSFFFFSSCDRAKRRWRAGPWIWSRQAGGSSWDYCCCISSFRRSPCFRLKCTRRRVASFRRPRAPQRWVQPFKSLPRSCIRHDSVWSTSFLITCFGFNLQQTMI